MTKTSALGVSCFCNHELLQTSAAAIISRLELRERPDRSPSGDKISECLAATKPPNEIIVSLTRPRRWVENYLRPRFGPPSAFRSPRERHFGEGISSGVQTEPGLSMD
jgi:hypothetical protein